VVETTEAPIVVAVTFVKVALVAVSVPSVLAPETDNAFSTAEANVAVPPFKVVTVPLVPVNVLSDVLPSTVKVEVTVELGVINPPNKYSSFVVVAPLFEICCNVAVVAAEPGQFVPFVRHTVEPFTNNCEVETTPDTNKLLEVTLVNVALVPVIPCKLAFPSTVNVEVTVDDEAMKPPNKYSSLVVEAPLLEICCSVEVEAALPGQFTPLARQTLNPFTSTAAAFNNVPEAVLNPNHEVEVPFVNVRFVMVPFVPNKFVVVTLVPVPFPKVTPCKLVFPKTVKVEVTVDDEAKKPPKKYNSFVVEAPLFEICCSVEVEAATPGQFVPLCKHTLIPFTSTALAFKVVPLAVAKPSQTLEVAAVNDAFVIEPFVAVRFVEKRLVDVTFVPVPFVKVSVPSVDAPITVNVEVTVELEPMNPPYNCKVVVANEPRALTEASVSASVGQFVPLCKQTSCDATYSCVVETTEAPRVVAVTFVKVALVAVSV